MVCTNDNWHAYPSVLTNAAAVLAVGDPPDYRALPDFPRPAAHAANAVAAALSLYKQALDAHVPYTVAKAALTAALLASIGSDNETYLEATMHPFQSTPCLPARLSTPCSPNTVRLLGQTYKSSGTCSFGFYRC